MNLSESEGVRLLSFDGGDLRAISQLSILDEFMRRVEWDKKSTDRILPCEYFHMMAGVGTGGIIAIFLTILRMGIEETIQEFISIWQTVYTDNTLDPTTRPVKLEETIKSLLMRKGIPESRRMHVENADEPPCKAFVCAVPKSNLGICEKFRSYKSRETSTNPTIVEAIRATCAVPKLFSPISIESIGCQVSYVTGAYNFNNPSREMIKEACEHFGKYRSVGFVVSLGAGQQGLLRVSTTNNVVDSSDPTAEMAFDCDQVARDLEWRLGELNAYHRLCVDRSLEYSGNSSNNPVGDIKAWTDGYLGQPDVMKKVDRCIASSQRMGDVILEQIALSQPQPTVEHLEQMQRELLPVRGSPHDAGNAQPTPLKVINAYGVQHVPCLQGTREKTLGAIRRWVDNEECTAKSIFFLLDVAGSGKSTVAKHMAEEWKKERRLLARFFFSRDTAETMSTNSFCLTVANAFALLDDNFMAHMSRFKKRLDFGLLSFEELFEGLVERPLKSIRRRAILIIDALDECDTEHHHRDKLLSTLNSRLSSIPQLRIFVTGRPEHDIKNWAKEKFGVGYTDFNQLEKGSRDLEVYVKHRLQGLPDIQSRLYLVIRHAEGLFIWARVACDLIVNGTDVDALLDELGREVKLDHLYKTALAQSAPNDGASRRATVAVLQMILAARKPLSIEDMEGLCPRSEIVESVVARLSSLLLYQSRKDPVRLLHATLREFLTTQARAGGHFIRLDAGHCTLASGCLNLIGRQFKKENPDPHLLDATSKRVFEYASTSWAYHCTNSYRKLALDEQILQFANNGLETWIHFIGQSGPHTFTNSLHNLIPLCRQKLSPQTAKRIVNRSLVQLKMGKANLKRLQKEEGKYFLTRRRYEERRWGKLEKEFEQLKWELRFRRLAELALLGPRKVTEVLANSLRPAAESLSDGSDRVEDETLAL